MIEAVVLNLGCVWLRLPFRGTACRRRACANLPALPPSRLLPKCICGHQPTNDPSARLAGGDLPVSLKHAPHATCHISQVAAAVDAARRSAEEAAAQLPGCPADAQGAPLCSALPMPQDRLKRALEAFQVGLSFWAGG